MNKDLITGTIGTMTSAVGTALQPNEVLQTISLVITIIGGIITLIVMPLVNWYQKAKADGKITKDEIKEGIDIATTGVKELEEDIKNKKGKE